MPFKPLNESSPTGESFRAVPGPGNFGFPNLKPKAVELPKKSFLQKTVGLIDNTLGRASDFAFGSFGKGAGSVITQGIGATQQLYGRATDNKKIYDKGTRLIEKTNKNFTPTNIAFSTLETYPGGGFVTKALRKVPGGAQVAKVLAKVPEKIRGKAVKQYAEALGATKEEFKDLTQKVVPELLDRGIKAKNLSTLSEQAIKKSDEAGVAIDDFIQNIPETTRMKVKPVIDALEKTKSEFIVDGVKLEPQIIKSADSLKKVIAQFGEEISPSSLRKVRQIWDKTVAKAGGFAGKTLKEGGEVDLKKVATSAIREELGKEFPDLAKLNAEFTFWENVQKITEATLKRKSTQGKGLSQVISSTVGGASGFASGDSVGERFKNAAIGAVLGKYVGAFNSPGYKMLSANTKNKLAKIIASGNTKKIEFAMAKILAALNNLTK